MIASAVLLVVAAALEEANSKILKLPSEWLALAVLPALFGLVASGYLGKVSAFGVSIEEPQLMPGKYVEPKKPSTRRTRSAALSEAPAWTTSRQDEYARTRNLQLVHVYRTSTRPGQAYDVSLYLMRHVSGDEPNQRAGLVDVAEVEFFLGPSWDDEVFTVEPSDSGAVALNTSAWGMFLATCRITFTDGTEPAVLHRYVDFEMAPVDAGG